MKKLLNVLAALSICGTVAGLSLETSVASAEVKEQTVSTRTVSDADIENYISGKTAPKEVFYPYDVLVNKVTTWTEENYFVNYSTDAMGEPYYDPDDTDYKIPVTYTFKKGYVYLLNAALVSRDASALEIQNNLASWNYDNVFAFLNLYNHDLNNSNSKFIYNKYLGSETDIHYEDDFSYQWDNQEVCSAIDSKWKSKINSIFDDTFTNHFARDGGMLLLVPSEDVVISRNQTALTWGLEAYIHKGKLLEGDYISPVIGGTINLSVNVDNQPSLEEILSHVKAIDETDGEVPITVTSSTYTQGEMKVGQCLINLAATDAAGNTGTEVIKIHRFDSTSPSIEGQDSYVLNYNHDITLQKILNNLTTSDNVDANLSLEVVSDTFSGNEHVIGNYQVVVRTKDLSNNYSANKTVNIAIKNQGNSVITAPKEITVTISSPLTLEALKERISVTDGYDGEVINYTIEGFDEYTRTERSVGINTITISYTNSGGNITTATIQIKKVDDKAPGIYFDSGYFVMLAPGEEFTMNQFKVQAAKVLMINVEDILDVQGEYDTSREGEYIITLSLADETVQEFTILVGDTNGDEPKDLGYFEQLWKDFTNVDNIFKFENWNWLHYVAAGIAGLLFISVLVTLVKRKK